jgi:pimeloyl-ACP methyl ester carboxylesterase
MRSRIAAVVVTIALFVGVSAPQFRAHRRAADVLRRFAASGEVSKGAANDATPRIDEIDDPREEGRLRWYIPRDARDAPVLVLVHGIHRLAIDEPRLVRFARALAENGIAVVTPEVRELADYRVDVHSIATIGAAAHAARVKFGRRAGIMGMSFAGGLSLLAACNASYQADIGMVVAVGAHDDAARVAQFFATDRIERTNHEEARFSAHAYGALVFVYAHADRFFSAEDLKTARASLAAWLAENRDVARAKANEVSPEAHELLTLLFDHEVGRVATSFLAAIDADRAALAAVSPRGRLEHLDIPVFLLHGAGDSVIPWTETEWLAKDVPRSALRDVLISRALVHVEPGGRPTWYEQWELLHFIAEVLETLDATSR